MSILHYQIMLYVADQNKSQEFYKIILQKKPDHDVPGMTDFVLGDNLKLELMPENGIAKILLNKTPLPNAGNGIPRCKLYLLVDNINESFELAKKLGAKEISKIKERDWGDSVGNVSDFGGNNRFYLLF